MLPSSGTYGFWLALVRIYLGLFWLQHGVEKLTDPSFAAPAGFMSQFLSKASQSAPAGAYRDFIANTVVPNTATFAVLVTFGETLVGVSLLLGLFTRLGGLGGAFLAANYWLAGNGPASLGGYTGLEFVVGVLCLIQVVLPTGRVGGFDHVLARRRSAERAKRAPVATPADDVLIARPVEPQPVTWTPPPTARPPAGGPEP